MLGDRRNHNTYYSREVVMWGPKDSTVVPHVVLFGAVFNERKPIVKRSAINRVIVEAREFFAENRFSLPPYADWTPEEWRKQGREADELRATRLGWDVTDFNSGRFDSVGLTLFTLRNGSFAVGRCSKGYAEKIMFVRQDQVAPYHYHARKTEDIINRGGKGRGRLVVRLYLYNSDGNGGFAQNPVPVLCDGIRREVEPGGAVILGPGESITLTPYLYHTFLRLRATV